MARLLMFLSLVLALSGHTACSPPDAPRNVLVITLDTTRADHLSCYGYPLELTPHIDAVARRGVLFERAYAPMGQTLPSHSTLFTGLWPRVHGALENHFLLSPDVTTLAEDLAARGYVTAGVTGTRVLDADTGIAQGIEHWDEEGMRREEGRKLAERKAPEVVDRALAWADRHLASPEAERPYFLWAHFFDPHTPFEAPPEFRAGIDEAVVAERVQQSRSRIRRVGEEPGHDPMARLAEYWADYAAEIRFTDHELGRLFDGLTERGLMQDTVVVIVGDHGEGLLEHGTRTHGMNLFDEVVRVPLIIATPNGELAGTRVDEALSIKDVRATVVGLADGSAPGGPDDLWKDLRARGALRPRPVILERPHYSDNNLLTRTNSFYTEGREAGPMLAIVAEGHKLVVRPDGGHWLFDLSATSPEFEDISARSPALTDRLHGMLQAWLDAHPVLHDADSQDLSPERLEMLEQLGYGR